ncbi:MAG: DUF4236 domain-containing protein [Candidatus Acidiferrales bacterium]
MGWNLRKPFNFGPFRVNVSKKGVGYSVGVRGLRVGQNARGQRYTQTSIPGTGIYNRSYSGTQSARRNWSLPLVIAVLLALLILKLVLK